MDTAFESVPGIFTRPDQLLHVDGAAWAWLRPFSLQGCIFLLIPFDQGRIWHYLVDIKFVSKEISLEDLDNGSGERGVPFF